MHVLIIGASGGIGLEFVRALLQEDSTHLIYGTYRSVDRAVDLLCLEQEYPEQLHSLVMDITQEAQICMVVDQLRQDIQSLDLVINCVGILHEGEVQPEKSLTQINPDHLLHYFEVNSVGSILLAKHLLPLFKHGNRSLFAILSAKIGSISDNHLGGWYGYRASKAALNMLMRTAAIEYRRKSPNTIIVLLHPGTTDTHLSVPFQRNVPPGNLFSVERTVKQLLTVLEQVTPEDSGQFFSWDGSRLPW